MHILFLSREATSEASPHVCMWELDHKEGGWAPKNWCFWIVMLEKTLEGPLDCKEIKPVSKKGNQLWIRKDCCWSCNTLATWCEELTLSKRPRCWKKLRAGGEGGSRGWDGWYYWLSGHEFEQTPGDNKRQGSLVCCGPWGHKELDVTWQLNNNREATVLEVSKISNYCRKICICF